MCKHAIYGELAKVLLFVFRVQQEQAKSCTLNKQTNQILYHPLYQIEGHSWVSMWRGEKLPSSSIITAMFWEPPLLLQKTHCLLSLLQAIKFHWGRKLQTLCPQGRHQPPHPTRCPAEETACQASLSPAARGRALHPGYLPLSCPQLQLGVLKLGHH